MHLPDQFFSDSNSHGRCIRGRQAIEHFWIWVAQTLDR